MKLTWTNDEIRTQLLTNINDDDDLKKLFAANLNLLGKIRAIIEAISRVIYDFIFDMMVPVYNNIFIYSSDKEALIQHLADHGLEPWKQAKKAIATVRIGSTTLPDAEKPIPQLALVGTEGSNSDEVKQFVLLSGGSINASTPADENGCYTIEINIESVEAGVRYNVSAGSINQLLTDIPGIDIVYNTADAAYGRDIESIDEVRGRIVTRKNAIYRGLLSWFVSETKEFSFVTDAVAVPRYAGRGTIGIALLTTSGMPTQDQKDEISAHFNNDEMDPSGAYKVVVFNMSTHVWNAAITVYYTSTIPTNEELNDALSIYFEQLVRGEDILDDQIDYALISNVNNLKTITIASHSGFAVGEYEFPLLGTVTWSKVEYAE